MFLKLENIDIKIGLQLLLFYNILIIIFIAFKGGKHYE